MSNRPDDYPPRRLRESLPFKPVHAGFKRGEETGSPEVEDIRAAGFPPDGRRFSPSSCEIRSQKLWGGSKRAGVQLREMGCPEFPRITRRAEMCSMSITLISNFSLVYCEPATFDRQLGGKFDAVGLPSPHHTRGSDIRWASLPKGSLSRRLQLFVAANRAHCSRTRELGTNFQPRKAWSFPLRVPRFWGKDRLPKPLCVTPIRSLRLRPTPNWG